MTIDYWQALGGGVLIGLSALLLMLFNGKIAGISGILQGTIWQQKRQQRFWRIAFIVGIILGSGLAYHYGLAGIQLIASDPITIDFIKFELRQNFPLWVLALSGLLVGIGTSLGSGCTSGHGVCGIGRLSNRSIIATLIFMVSASVTVWIVRHSLGGL